jgi:hypothetical protein
VLQYQGFNWKTLPAMAGVTWWNFYFPGAIRSLQIIEFLAHLLRHIPGKLLTVWDGLPGYRYRSRATWEFIPPAARAIMGRVSSRLCAGTESGRVFVVALETTRVAELPPAELRTVDPTCSPSTPPDAQTAHFGDSLLATGGTVSFATILCNAQ